MLSSFAKGCTAGIEASDKMGSLIQAPKYAAIFEKWTTVIQWRIKVYLKTRLDVKSAAMSGKLCWNLRSSCTLIAQAKHKKLYSCNLYSASWIAYSTFDGVATWSISTKFHHIFRFQWLDHSWTPLVLAGKKAGCQLETSGPSKKSAHG